MTGILSSPLRTTMIECLPTVQYLLEKCPSSLSACEKGQMQNFATLVAENMANDPEDPITILLYSITHPVNTELHASDLPAVVCAINSLALGVSVRLCQERSRVRARLTSPGMYAKNGRPSKIIPIGPHLLRGCHSGPE